MSCDTKTLNVQISSCMSLVILRQNSRCFSVQITSIIQSLLTDSLYPSNSFRIKLRRKERIAQECASVRQHSERVVKYLFERFYTMISTLYHVIYFIPCNLLYTMIMIFTWYHIPWYLFYTIYHDSYCIPYTMKLTYLFMCNLNVTWQNLLDANDDYFEDDQSNSIGYARWRV